MKKYNLVKSISWYTLGNILVKGVAFLLLPVFTNLMNTRDYGIYAIYTSYMSLVEVVVLFGLSSTVRILKYSDGVDFEKYMSCVVKIPIFLTAILCFIVNVIFIFQKNLFSLGRTEWNCLFITAAFSAVLGIISARLVIEGKYLAYMVYSLGTTLLSLGLSVALGYTLFYGNNVYMARIFGGMIPSVIFGLLFWKLFIKRSHFSWKMGKYAITLGFPLLLHTAATVVLTQTDKILINYFCDFEYAGIYSIAITMIIIPMTLQTSMESGWAPWFYQKLKDQDYNSIKKVNNAYIIFFFTITLGFMLLCPELIHLFTNEAYWDSVYSLIPLSISVFAEMLYCLVVNIEYFNKKTWMISQGTIITVIFNIVLDVVLIKIFGYVGAAYGTAIAKCGLFFIHWHWARRIDKNRIFSPGCALGCLALLLIFDVVVSLLVNQPLVRYSILLICVGAGIIFVVKNKEFVRQVFKRK